MRQRLAQLEEEMTLRQQAEEALRENEERFHRFLEITHEGLVFHEQGEQGKIFDVNPALVAMLGYSEVAELVGKSPLELIAPEAREAVVQYILARSTQPYETLALRKNGTVFPMETSARTYETQGNIIRVVSVRDITERKQTEANQAKVQQEVIEAQQRAIAELSTPVIPIMDRIIVMPLIGSVDSLRARDITRTLLAGLSWLCSKISLIGMDKIKSAIFRFPSGALRHR
jgi:PAS domain S-box-containing protein